MLRDNGIDLELILLDLRHNLVAGEAAALLLLLLHGVEVIEGVSLALSRGGDIVVGEAAVGFRLVVQLIFRQCRGGGDPEEPHLLCVVGCGGAVALTNRVHQLSADR